MCDCFRTTLTVVDGKLYGGRGTDRRELSTAEITRIRVYGFNNPFLELTTTAGRFRVGALTRHYDDVVRFLEQHKGVEFEMTMAFRFNDVFYRRRYGFASFVTFLRTKLTGRRISE